MSSIDERVVQMKFDNAQFEKGVKDTTKSLEGLSKSLDMKGAKTGLAGLAQAAKGFTLGGINNAVQGIASKFTRLGIVGVTALANIANRAVNAGITLGKSLTIDPIMQGFGEYETKMGSIQTILANTARHGTTLEDVSGALGELNDYADKTIYNFADMTKNIGLFTNAGIDVGPATSMIKGFSNAAAASGTTSQGASNAAYQLSQAMSAGTIRLMDWRSLTNVGMGNKNMQEGILDIAEAMGTFEGTGIDAKTAAEDFNGSLEKGWLSADVMSSYLEIMAGDMDAAAMAAMGLSDEQIKSFQAQQKTAEEAATKVRTFTQLIGTLQEAVGSGWAQTFEILLGDFNEATELFTNISDTLGGMIGGMSDARNNLLQGWADGGGRAMLIEALSNAFEGLMGVIKPIGDAFRQIFPPVTVDTLLSITTAIRDFSKHLIVGEETADKIKRSFAGLFAILGIGWEILKALGSAVFEVIGPLMGASGGVLTATATFGDFLVMLHDLVKESNIFGKVFGGVAKGISAAIGWIGDAIGWIADKAGNIGGVLKNALGNMDFSWLVQILDNLKKRLEPLGKIGDWVADKFEKLIGILQGGGKKGGGGGKKGNPLEDGVNKLEEVKKKLQPLFDAVEKVFTGIKDLFKGFDPSLLFDGLNLGGMGIIALLIKKLIGTKEGGTSFELDLGLKSFGESIKTSVGAITESLSAMTGAVKAATVLQIAAAIAILAAAAVVLASIDSEALTRSLTAIGIMLLQLGGAMKMFTDITSTKELGEILVLNAALILLGIALNILASAVKKLSELSWEELAKGLLGTIVLLGALVGVTKLMGKGAGGMIRAGIGLVVIAAALKLLVSSVTDLADMTWQQLLAGIGGVTLLLLAIAGFTRLVGSPGKTLAAALALAVMGGAMKILASAITDMGTMSWDEMVRGLTGLGIGLGLITGALTLIKGKNELAGAVVFAIAAGAIMVLGDSLKQMGDMQPEEIAKAIVTLSIAIGIIVAAMKLMTGAVVGAATMVIIAGALWILVPLLVELGGMTWNEIAKASVALLAALGLIAAGMYVMSGTIVGAATMLIIVAALWVLVPLFVELGEMSWNEIAKASVALLAALGLIAAGMYLMSGTLVGAAALVVVAAALWVLVPVFLALSLLSWGTLLMGLGAMAGIFLVLAVGGIALLPAIPGLLGLGAALLLIGLGVGVAAAGLSLFATAFGAVAAVIVANGPAMVDFIKQLIMLIPLAATQLALGLTAFAQVIIQAAPIWAQAVIALISAVLVAIQEIYPLVAETVWGVVQTIMDTLVENVPALVQKGFELLLGILQGIRDNIQQVVETGLEIIENFIKGVENGLPSLVDSAYSAMITFIDELAATIENNQARMERASRRLAEAIINALIGGIGAFIGGARNAWREKVGAAISDAKSAVVARAKRLASDIINGLKTKLSNMASAAITFKNKVGKAISDAKNYVVERAKRLAGNIISGMVKGVGDGGWKIANAVKTAAGNALDAAKKRLGINSPSKEFMKIGQWSSEGMANGITEYGKMVSKASSNVGGTAMDAMKKSISNIGNIITDGMDGDPTIRPVLDLSAIKRDAGLINGMLGSQALSAGSTFAQASSISAMANAGNLGVNADVSGVPMGGVGMTFIQNNTSPVALNPVDIYRNTNNQLSAAKGALSRNANIYSAQGRG